MKKFLIALLFLVSTLAFGQDGRTRVNFYNQVGVTLQFMLNGRPACSYAVMPGGMCTESVNPGNYTATATDGTNTTGGQNFDIAYGETYNYRVFPQQSATLTPGLVRVADLDYHNGFTINAPLELKTDGPTNNTTDAGKPFTQTLYSATMPNTDVYMVGVSAYNFAVDNADLDRGIEGFRGSLKGTVLSTTPFVVSGQPAKMAVIDAKDSNGRELRFALLITFKGTKAYMFVFGSYLDVPNSNGDEFKTFFNSARIQ